MSRVVSGYERLFQAKPAIRKGRPMTDAGEMEKLKESAVEYIQQSFKDNPKEQARFLLNNTKCTTVQANVSVMVLCEESDRGKMYRKQVTTLNGYKSYESACDMDTFYYLCLVPDVPKATWDNHGRSTRRNGRKGVCNGRDERLESLRKGTILATQYINVSNATEQKEMEDFKRKLKGDGMKTIIWALNGVTKHSTTMPSIFSLHQRVSLLHVVWQQYVKFGSIQDGNWIADSGYKMIDGNNPDHFHHYAAIAQKHSVAIDEYIRNKLNNSRIQSETKLLQTRDGRVPRSISVCVWKNFLPKNVIENFVKDVCNGGVPYIRHNNKYIRMAKSPDYPLKGEFFISASKFPCEVACRGEIELMEHVNAMLALQNPLLEEEEKTARIELSKTQPVTVMLTAISRIGTSCGFNEHNDWSTLLATSADDEVLLEDGAPLPKRHLMQVFTVGWVYPLTDDPCVECTVEWKYGGKRIGKIITTTNFGHMQFFGLNDEFFAHVIKYEYRGVTPQAARCVTTFRRIFSCDPSNRQAYDAKVTEECNSKGTTNKPTAGNSEVYVHKNVMNKVLGKSNSDGCDDRPTTQEEIDKSNATEGSGANNKRRIKRLDTKFRQLTAAQYKLFCLPRPPQPQCWPEPLGTVMARARITRKLLLEHHTLVYRHYGDNQSRPVLFMKENGNMYIPGERVNMQSIATTAGIVYNSHQHNFAPTNPLNDTVFMLGFQPKNDCPGLRQTYDLIQKGINEEVSPEKIQLPDIFTFGSGGNPNKQGVNAPPTLYRASKRDAAVKMQTAQTIANNTCNSTAEFFHHREFMVAVMANDSLLGIEKSRTRGDAGRFIFVYRIHAIELLERISDEDRDKHVVEYGQGYSKEDFSFLLNSHIKIKMTPAMSFAEYMKLYKLSKTRRLKQLYFPWDTKTQIVASNLPNMVSKDGFMEHPDKIFTAFIDVNKEKILEATVEGNINSMDLNNQEMDLLAGEVSLKEDCYKATPADLVMCCILISVANAYRHGGDSLVWIKGDKTRERILTAIPLIARWQHWYLGITNQCVPINPPNRSLDVVVLLQQYLFNKQCNNGFKGKLLQATEGQTFSWQAKMALFVAIVTRFTGSATAIIHYETQWKQTHRSHKNNGPFMKQKRPHISDFVTFLESIATARNEIGYVISKKHRQAFYPMLKNNLQKYTNFLTAVTNNFDNYANELWNLRNKMSRQHTRECALNKTKLFLGQCIYNNNTMSESAYENEAKGLPFLAHACLADWEELFEEPVGPITFDSIRLGPGGESALDLIAHTMNISRQEAADEVLRVIKDLLPDKWVLALGFIRRRKTVCSPTNYRLVSYSDIDQSCCKFYSLVISTHPTRTASQTPDAHKPHCEPVRLHGDEYDFNLHQCTLSNFAHAAFGQVVEANEEILGDCINDDGTEKKENAPCFKYVYPPTATEGQSDSTIQTFYYHIVPDIPQMPGETEYLNGRTRRQVAQDCLTEWKHTQCPIGTIRTITMPRQNTKKRKATMACTTTIPLQIKKDRNHTTLEKMSQIRKEVNIKAARASDKRRRQRKEHIE